MKTSQFPRNVLMQYPTGRWGFAGRVDARLAYACYDGTEANDDQIGILARYGSMMAGLEKRTFATRQEAIDAAGGEDEVTP